MIMATFYRCRNEGSLAMLLMNDCGIIYCDKNVTFFAVAEIIATVFLSQLTVTFFDVATNYCSAPFYTSSD
jgi:hypothetical protein